MRARLLVVMKIASQSPPQRRLVPHNDVIQALAANRSDQSFHIGILPRRSRRRDHFFDPHILREGNNGFATARVIHAIQDAPKPAAALDVTVIGHQFWWEFRYPTLGIVTANELHIPASDPAHPTPTLLKLLSADADHSFWVPGLGGKTDLIPNRVNEMWIDPPRPGIYLGQCAQYCGTQHAKMLLRVSVDGPADFAAWVHAPQQVAHRQSGYAIVKFGVPRPV